jgi:hypothetical protein
MHGRVERQSLERLQDGGSADVFGACIQKYPCECAKSGEQGDIDATQNA